MVVYDTHTREPHLRYLPVWELPADAGGRFERLFAASARWTKKDLEPFIAYVLCVTVSQLWWTLHSVRHRMYASFG